MKELDLLKKDWNKEQHPKVSSEAIYKMILKKSSSAVKWIFIISIIEFALGLISGIVYHPELNSEYKMPWIYGWPTTIIVTSIALYFIIVFYKNHRTINTTNSVKELLESSMCSLNIFSLLKTNFKTFVTVPIFCLLSEFLFRHSGLLFLAKRKKWPG